VCVCVFVSVFVCVRTRVLLAKEACDKWSLCLVSTRPGFKYYLKSLKMFYLCLIELSWPNGTNRIVTKLQHI
jgi:hypothetical protein